MIQVGTASGSYNTVALATSCTLDLSSSMSSTVTKDDNDLYECQEITSQDWTLSTDNLISVDSTYGPVDLTTLMGYISNGTLLYVSFAYLEGSLGTQTTTGTWTGVADATDIITGTVRLTSIQANFENKNNASYTAQFAGVGAPTVAS